ncbi:mycothiol synthase [Curtobacterium flaccumfaciens pv. oortii]|uniref:mycothiol synthase n=1 Tax=Curtobacterium flaccumfaciens TaxID=2035 RepID=UPI001BDEE37F|nr:mycothiol synthase [Curtobacterium flaccumfaciens]MBT1622915.1 mycothiol synthase [Curtobacterium flaccumfaciens pv. oortii]
MPDLARFVVPGEAPPFSDQTLVDVRAGRATVLAVDDGVAVVRDGELELVVDREARGRGTGTALVTQALALGGGAAPVLAWAHGDHPAARALADRFGWRAVRTLLQLRAPIDGAEPSPDAAPAGVPAGYSLSAFRPGTEDEADWLALNAAAFVHHPEQGRMTLDDLHARESDAWFSGEDLLLLRDASGQLAGSCWLKVEDGIGEFYAVAVRPDLQGQRLGGVLMRAGTARLTGRGLTAAALYVEGDNEPALALYRRSGFVQHAIDVQYAAPEHAEATTGR